MRTTIHYSAERKAALLKKLLPPESVSVSLLSRQEGIAESTLYTWRIKAMKREGIMQAKTEWTAEARFAVIVETETLSANELGEYCRQRGLYPEQIKQWRKTFIDSEKPAKPPKTDLKTRREINRLKKELARKEKALAEAAALLVLRKKLKALYGESDEED